MFLLPEACSQNRPEAAVLQLSLQVPGDSGCKATCAWVLMAPALLLLEVTMVKGVVFFSPLFIYYNDYIYYRRRSWVAGMCIKDKGTFPFSLPGNLHKLPFLFFSWSTAVLFQRKCLHSLVSANTAAVVRSAQLSGVSSFTTRLLRRLWRIASYLIILLICLTCPDCKLPGPEQAAF